MGQLLFIDIYRQAFQRDASPGFYWDDGTFILYVAMIVCVSVAGYFAGNVRRKSGARGWFVLAASILIFVLGFRGQAVGVDTHTYREDFEDALRPDAFKYSTIEPGFRLLQKFLRLFLPSAQWDIFVFSFFTVFSVFRTCWRYRAGISLFVAFSFYVGLFYFQAMNLLRIYFAASFIFFNFHYLIEGKYMRFLLVVLIATTIHFSSIINIMPVLFLWLYEKHPTWPWVAFVVSLPAITILGSNFERYMVFARYKDYAPETFGHGLGLMLFFEYIPCFLLVAYTMFYRVKGQWTNLLICFSLSGFFFRIASYLLIAGGRLQVHFLPLFVLIIPYFVHHIKQHHRTLYVPTMLFLILYLCVRCHYYFSGYLSVDEIMPYEFFWNNISSVL